MTPDDDQGPYATDANLARSTAAFFKLSAALALSEAENRALLDLPAEVVATLRSGTAQLSNVDQTKLQRRLNYAIPILQRMLASSET